MSVKKRPDLDKENTNIEKDDVEKEQVEKVHTDSNISHSSWIHKLTSTPSPSETNSLNTTEIKVDLQEPKRDEIVEPDVNSSSTADSTGKEQNAAGIWSWLGYSGTNTSSDDLKKDSREHDMTPPENDTKEKEEEKEEVEEKEKDVEKSRQPLPSQSKPSYWKYLFSSSTTSSDNNQRDSVIISDDNSEEQPPVEQNPDMPSENDTTMADVTRKIPLPPSKNNIVLPSFSSQFEAPPLFETNNENNANIFTKAICAINSIFTQKPAAQSITSDWQDINHLNSMIDQMKSDPEHVAGKKIVIIGVHGWFPMKVSLV